MLAKLFFTVEKSTSLLAKGPVCSTHANADSWCLVCAQPCGQVARFRQPKTYVFLSLTFRNFKQMKVDYRSSESLCYGLKVWFIVYTIPLNLICYIWGRNQMNGIAVFWSRVKWQREQSITCKMLMLLPLLQLCSFHGAGSGMLLPTKQYWFKQREQSQNHISLLSRPHKCHFEGHILYLFIT